MSRDSIWSAQYYKFYANIMSFNYVKGKKSALLKNNFDDVVSLFFMELSFSREKNVFSTTLH